MNKFNFDEVKRRARSVKLDLILANTAKNEFLKNFKDEGFDGNKWKKRKKTIGDKPILIGQKRGGKLRKDVANSVSTGHSNGRNSYTLVVENEYAIYHNEGIGNMRKRQFVGLTKNLNTKLLLKVKQNYDMIWGA